MVKFIAFPQNMTWVEGTIHRRAWHLIGCPFPWRLITQPEWTHSLHCQESTQQCAETHQNTCSLVSGILLTPCPTPCFIKPTHSDCYRSSRCCSPSEEFIRAYCHNRFSNDFSAVFAKVQTTCPRYFFRSPAVNWRFQLWFLSISHNHEAESPIVTHSGAPG